MTIQLWTNECYYEAHSARTRVQRATRDAKQGRFRLPGSTEAYKTQFMLTLRREGVAVRDIARVCTVVFGERVSYDQVRYRLRDEPASAAARLCGCGAAIIYEGRGRPPSRCDDCRVPR